MLKKVLCISVSAGLLFISGCFSGVNSSGGEGSSVLNLVVPKGSKDVKLSFVYEIKAEADKVDTAKAGASDDKTDVAKAGTQDNKAKAEDSKTSTVSNKDLEACKVEEQVIQEVTGELVLNATIKNVCLERKDAIYTAKLSLKAKVNPNADFKTYAGEESFSSRNKKEDGKIHIKITLEAADGSTTEVTSGGENSDLIVSAEIKDNPATNADQAANSDVKAPEGELPMATAE